MRNESLSTEAKVTSYMKCTSAYFITGESEMNLSGGKNENRLNAVKIKRYVVKQDIGQERRMNEDGLSTKLKKRGNRLNDLGM